MADTAPVTTSAPEVTPAPAEETKPYVKPRGSFAEAVAKDTKVVEQELLKNPAESKSKGISRI